MLRLALSLFLVQAGFHGFTAALPVALARGGVSDPLIGLIVGTAALVQIPAALVAGALLDRFGGVRLFAVGGVAYIVGTGILLLPGVQPGDATLPFFAARIFQGIGIAATLPSALALVPRLMPPHRRGFGLAFMGSAHNLTLVALPPVSLIILTATSLDGVALAMLGLTVVGLVLLFAAPLRLRPLDGDAAGEALGAARRRLGFAFRRSWTIPLAIVLLYVAHWGVIIGYLPQRAEAAGADVGLFFVADGLAVLLLRIPSGWLADRTRPIILLIAGFILTAISIGMLVLPATTPQLVVAGALTGAGAGLLLTPLLVELSRRSGEADRGSAFALFSASLAAALALGSIGAAPLVGAFGFEAAIVATLLGLVGAIVLSFLDPSFRLSPGAARAGRASA